MSYKMQFQRSISKTQDQEQMKKTLFLTVSKLPKLIFQNYNHSTIMDISWNGLNSGILSKQFIVKISQFKNLHIFSVLRVTNANNHDAIQILHQKRFGDHNYMIRSLYNELRNISPSTPKTQDLRRL